jgi:hypothetical protein
VHVQECAVSQDRIVVLIDAERKAEIEAKAKAFNMSVGEFARRSMEAYDPELEKLSELLVDSTRDAKEALAKAHADVDEALEYFASKREAPSSSQAVSAVDHMMAPMRNGNDLVLFECKNAADYLYAGNFADAVKVSGLEDYTNRGYITKALKDELLKSGIHITTTRPMHAGGSIEVGPKIPVVSAKARQPEKRK